MKAACKLYKTCFYIVATFYGWLILKDTEIYPWLLGGSATTGNEYWIGTPYTPQIPNILMYSLITMGYHIGELIDHTIVQEHTTDFREMLLHHIATLILYGGMLVNNAVRVGCVIAFLHVIADIPISAAQMFSQLRFSIISGISFISGILLWLYTRLIVFPWLIWSTFNFYVLPPGFDKVYDRIQNIKIFLLMVLCVLHVYWFCKFIKLLHGYLFQGKTEDTVNLTRKIKI